MNILEDINNIAKEQIIVRDEVGKLWLRYFEEYWESINTKEEFISMRKELLSYAPLTDINALVVLQCINIKVKELELSDEYKVSLGNME